MNIVKNIALGAVGAGIVMLGISLASSQSGSLSTVVAVPAPADQEAFVNTAESTINGVVSVKSFATPHSRYSQGGSTGDPFFDFFFGAPQRQPQQPSQEQQRQIGLGSGVIISADGYIVTNNHVIDQAERLEVTLNDNRNFNATVVGADPVTDLALIKIDAPELHVIPMGRSEDLRVGEWVLAVGNPFGFTSTVTSGIVSAKGRNISSTQGGASRGNIESYIQTDAALNAGNSGGALVNLKGELVGINTAIYSQTGNYAGCSFAIPTSIVTKVVGDLKQYGAVQRAMLGIRFGELTPELIKEKGIEGVAAGLYVGAVEDRSAAMEAGIEEGDVIVGINGEPTHNTAQIQEALAKLSPGDKATIEFVRNGKHITKTATVRNGRGNTAITRAGSVTDLGCAFAKVDDDTLQQLGLREGVKVTGLEDGPMKDAGIRDGLIILSINNNRVRKPDDVEQIYNAVVKSEDADKVLFIKGIYPTGKQAFYAVPLISD